MYMSRIALNARRRGAMKLLTNRHAMHAAVLSSFAPEVAVESSDGRVLWRVDRSSDRVDLLIVSPERPCLAHVAEQAGWSTENCWATRDYAPFLSSINDGDEFTFRLSANPTHRLTTAGRTKIVGHRTAGYQRQWLVDKSHDCGFVVLPSSAATTDGGDAAALQLELSDRDRVSFHRNGTAVTLDTVRFDGALRVHDSAAFKRSLGHGIGRAKGYGCGLMTVLPRQSR